ncbi:MAG TPA: GNAT family N-acetyltransferase [Patescibacteria group bacterium]|nr:GNAT family N-acetyltransferase [Patescibacteria group bacterium]
MTANAGVTVAIEPFDSEDARRLVRELDEHLAARYLPEQRFGPNLKPAQLAAGLGTFVVARCDGEAVGCGALRRLDGTTGELKRMYVAPEQRGRGVGRQILARLEAEADGLGIARLVLETGIHQAEAIGLYRAAGFKETPCWGEYATSATSVCFEKLLPR